MAAPQRGWLSSGAGAHRLDQHGPVRRGLRRDQRDDRLARTWHGGRRAGQRVRQSSACRQVHPRGPNLARGLAAAGRRRGGDAGGYVLPRGARHDLAVGFGPLSSCSWSPRHLGDLRAVLGLGPSVRSAGRCRDGGLRHRGGAGWATTTCRSCSLLHPLLLAGVAGVRQVLPLCALAGGLALPAQSPVCRRLVVVEVVVGPPQVRSRTSAVVHPLPRRPCSTRSAAPSAPSSAVSRSGSSSWSTVTRPRPRRFLSPEAVRPAWIPCSVAARVWFRMCLGRLARLSSCFASERAVRMHRIRSPCPRPEVPRPIPRVPL